MSRRCFLLLVPLLLVLAGCQRPPSYTGGRVDKLTIIDEKVGDGVEAKPGMDVLVHYTGWLYDEHAADKRGAKFDSSLDRGTPFPFRLGAGRVIPGWDRGVAGMRVGGKRLLLIPPQLGYGERGAGDAIPPGASLVFEVQLLDADTP